MHVTSPMIGHHLMRSIESSVSPVLQSDLRPRIPPRRHPSCPDAGLFSPRPYPLSLARIEITSGSQVTEVIGLDLTHRQH